MSLYRQLFEAHGWSPERLSELTPKQLLGIAGGKGGDRPGRKFASIAEAAAAYRAEKAGGGG